MSNHRHLLLKLVTPNILVRTSSSCVQLKLVRSAPSLTCQLQTFYRSDISIIMRVLNLSRNNERFARKEIAKKVYI